MKTRKELMAFRKEEAEICDSRCPHPACKKGYCDFYKAEIRKLRVKYGQK